MAAFHRLTGDDGGKSPEEGDDADLIHVRYPLISLVWRALAPRAPSVSKPFFHFGAQPDDRLAVQLADA
jgi:hypothetical protein